MAPHAEEVVGQANGFATASAPAKDLFTVNSPNVEYTDDTIKSKYTYRTTDVTQNAEGKYVAVPKETLYDFKVDRKVPKVGVMLVGWGGNNGHGRYHRQQA
jgi:myo-inositol-1-phosphate synthase